MPLTRREFLSGVAASAAFGPSIARAQEPKVRHASMGASGQAHYDVMTFAKHPAFELVAVADVDLCVVSRLQQTFPAVRVYQDWRELLKKEDGRIDSVNVSTPDHMHAVIAMAAMRRHLHVYVQKPLANTIHEVRVLTEFARRQGVVTQMGIQVSSSAQQRMGEAAVRSGLIGKVKEVHVFSNKSWGQEGPVAPGSDPIPPTLDWDAWIGVAEPRPFKKGAFHPGEWRRRVGFGTGTLGDMGCHIFSPPYRALGLTSPISITSHGPAPADGNWAVRGRYHYAYPGTDITEGKTVDVWWYDGSERPGDAILSLVDGKLPDQGTVFVGADGALLLPHGDSEPLIYKSGKFAARASSIIEPRDHYGEFLDAVLNQRKCSAGFDYAGPLSESVLLGNVAAWFPNETLEFDAKALRFPNKAEATARLTRTYRKGWDDKALR